MRPASEGPPEVPGGPAPKLGIVKTSRRWILYSLLRVGIFAAILALLLALKVEPWMAAVVAAVVGLCVSYIFFRPQRDALALSVARFRQSEKRDADSDAENAALDLRETATAPLKSEGSGEAHPEN
ncbi:MAG: DUF4229 domain-containing protein [Microbacteriaceae bacterium]|nr:DUF4229 domain-containing protein [Microbacteriaceae bacterium]